MADLPLPVADLKCAVTLAVVAMLAAAARAEPPTTTPATRPAFNPISYYQDNCSRCHGSYGSGYLPELIGRRSDAELRQVVEEMTVGPAQAPIDGEALAALVAYHRSIVRGEPFISRSAAAGGEVTPGATVVAETDGRRVEATVEQHAWRMNGVTGAASLVAEKDGKPTRLGPGETHSHTEPLETTSDR